ncbi:acidic mammalian chitinase-like isoform X2 [Paroedura picta]|uniref:acidic mammalian chitinase-like isoform X2 n=1 Tax=Paroedura picta TaxID=143630 RepID=UPI004055B813
MGNLFLWASCPYKLVCYVTNWAHHRKGAARLTPEDIDPFLCSHLIYAFAGITNNQIATTKWNDEILYMELNNLKERNKKLRTLVSVGGGNFDARRFSTMASSQTNRQIFIQSVIDFLHKYHFDGLDLDWEYPRSHGNAQQDKHHFTILVQELMAAFVEESKRTGRRRLLLSAAVASSKRIIDDGYEIPALGKSLDFISVMTYDFHGAWGSVTGHNSPLHKGLASYDPNVFYNCEYAMKYWKDNGAPAKKLLMGFPTYGKTFRLSSEKTGVGAPVSGAGSPGAYTHEAGVLAYFEVCTFLQGATLSWITEQKVPYAVKDMEWVGYDNERSFQLKAEFLKKQNYGGAMVWTLDLDDVSGTFCGQGSNVLVNTLKDALE